MLLQTLILPPLLALLLCIHLGYAWSKLLLPPELQPYRALALPLLGLALFITIAAALTNTTSLTVPQIAAGLALLAVPLNVWAWRRTENGRSLSSPRSENHEAGINNRKPSTELRAETWFLILSSWLSILVFVIAILPLLRWNLSAPIGSNWDGAEFYVPLGRALQLRSQRDLATLPRNPLVHILTTPPVSGRIHAFSYLHAAISSASRVDPLRSYAPIMAWTVALQPLAVYPLGRVLRLRRGAALLAALLVSLAWLPLWVAFNNFSNHVLALPLLPIALAASYVALCTKTWRALLTGGLLMGGLATAYYPAMTAFVALFGFAALYLLWRSPDRFYLLRRGAALAGLAFLISGAAQYAFFLREGFLDEILRRGTGFQVTEYVDLRSALGVAATFNREAVLLHAWLVWVAVAAALLFGLLAIVGRRAPLLVAMLLGAIAYQGLTAAQAYHYGFYKGITLEIPIFALLIAAGAEYGWDFVQPRARWTVVRGVLAASLLLIAGLNAFTIWNVQQRYAATGPQLWTPAELDAIAVADELPPSASVLLVPSPVYPPTFASLLSYTLLGHELAGRISTGYTTIEARPGDQLPDAALLPEEDSPSSYGYEPGQLAWAGSKMRLYRRAPYVRYHRALTSGGNVATIPPGASLALGVGPNTIALPGEPQPSEDLVQPPHLTLAGASFGPAALEIRAADLIEQHALPGGLIELTTANVQSNVIELHNTGATPIYLLWAELRDPVAQPGIVPRDDVFVQAQPLPPAPPTVSAEIVLHTPPLPQGVQKLTGLLTITHAAREGDEPREIGRWVFFPGGGQRLRLTADPAQLTATLSEGDQPRDLFGSAQGAGDGTYQMTLLFANNAQIVYGTQLWTWRVAAGSASDIVPNSVPFELISLPQPATIKEAVAQTGTLRLRGYTFARKQVRAGETLRPSVVWQSLGKLEENVQARAVLQAEDGQVLAEQTLPLGAPEHGTSTWQEGEIAEQTFDLTVPSATSPGLIRLVIELVDQQNRRIPWTTGDAPVPLTDITVAP